MPEEYDKLAWGLVRDEIRRLTKYVGKDDFEKAFANILVQDGVSNFKRGALKEKEVPAFRQNLIGAMKENLCGFRHQSQRGRMGTDTSFSRTQIDSMLFWSHSDLHIMDTDNPRVEKFLELRSMIMSLSRKKLTSDLASCFVVVNEHTLYRLVQRGACDRNPLRMLTDDIDNWLDGAVMAMFTASFVDNSNQGVFIPYRNGALLGKLRFSQIAESCRTFHPSADMRPAPRGYRFIDSVKGKRVIDIPYQNILVSKSGENLGVVSAHISTWIPESYFHDNQWWSKNQIEQLRKKFPEEIAAHGDLMRSPTKEVDEETLELILERRHKYSQALIALINDERWQASSS